MSVFVLQSNQDYSKLVFECNSFHVCMPELQQLTQSSCAWTEIPANQSGSFFVDIKI